MRPQLLARSIGTEFANHLHGITQPSHRDGLIGTFAPRMHLKPASVHRLSRGGDMVGVGDKIKVDTSHHNNRFLAGAHASSLFLQTR
jgi:hypothetical protein